MKQFYESITPAHLLGNIVFVKNYPKDKKIAEYRSIEDLNSDIVRVFGCFNYIEHLSNHYNYLKEIAQSYKIKLISEGYEYCGFETSVKGKKTFAINKLELDDE